MTNKELADLIFPNITKTIEDYNKIYPKRNLPEGAIVTRYAPSPTGFVHVGALFASFVGKMFAEQSEGVFYLRVEDTDTKRTIDNGVATIINGLLMKMETPLKLTITLVFAISISLVVR